MYTHLLCILYEFNFRNATIATPLYFSSVSHYSSTMNVLYFELGGSNVSHFPNSVAWLFLDLSSPSLIRYTGVYSGVPESTQSWNLEKTKSFLILYILWSSFDFQNDFQKWLDMSVWITQKLIFKMLTSIISGVSWVGA